MAPVCNFPVGGTANFDNLLQSLTTFFTPEIQNSVNLWLPIHCFCFTILPIFYFPRQDWVGKGGGGGGGGGEGEGIYNFFFLWSRGGLSKNSV